jgi:hypothetical protein
MVSGRTYLSAGVAKAQPQKEPSRVRNTSSDTVISSPSISSGRRRFLSRAGGAAVATVVASTVGSPSLSLLGPRLAQAAEPGQANAKQRAKQAYDVRNEAAQRQMKLALPEQLTNGDDERYGNRIGSYSKGLPHNKLGEVAASAYDALLHALATSDASDFEKIPLGGVAKQANPQAAFAFSLEGSDSHQLGTVSPPAFSSPEQAAEMVELYWQALTRDVPFARYETDPLINSAAAELSTLSAFRGPKDANNVTSATVFRGIGAGSLLGPYISQFLWQDIPYPATPIVQRIRTADPGVDYMTEYDKWLRIQNGAVASELPWMDLTPRYVRNGRDLAEYVHSDFTYQHFLNACLILLSFGSGAIDPNNPYKRSRNQSGFSTFGPPHVFDLLARVANCALNCAWYQKWLVHRRLRPEEFGGRIHNHRTGAANYPLSGDVLSATVLDGIFARHGTYLLPMSFPEGCPTHPAYPAGHAVIAGACVTALKAVFNESFVIRRAVEASADGLSLVPYKACDLSVGGELNKLASNISIGRDVAGLHWRSDAMEGLKLGEAVAISIMSDMKGCFNESFNGFSLTKFDGSPITV